MQRRQRIAFYTDSRAPFGVWRWIEQLGTALDKDMFDVTAFAPEVPLLEDMLLRMKENSICIVRYPDKPLGAFLTLFSHGRRQPFDLIDFHLGYPFSCRFGIAAARFLPGTKVLTTEHLPMDRKLNTARKWLKRRLMSGYRDIITVSEYNRNILLNQYNCGKHRIEVIRTGTDLTRKAADGARERVRESLGVKPEDSLILTVANLNSQKGHEHLLRAAAEITSARQRVIFAFAGVGPLEDDLRKMCSELSLDGIARWLGYRNDVTELIAASDLCVLPSLFEGIPFFVIEAMAGGKAVVATSVSGVPEAVAEGKTGLLVPPEDSQSLARAIMALLDDPDRSKLMGRAGRTRAENMFNVDDVVRRTQERYLSLLANKI